MNITVKEFEAIARFVRWHTPGRGFNCDHIFDMVQNGITAVQVEEEAVTACDAIQNRHWKNQERNAARMRECRKLKKRKNQNESRR